MKRDLFVIFLCFIAGLSGANVQPVLTGAGKILFPENAVPANLQASGGTLNINAGGTNGNIALTPTGNGWTQAASSILSLGLSSGFPSTNFVRMTIDTSGSPTSGDVLAFNGAGSAYIPLRLRGSVVYVGNGNFGAGNNSSPNYAVDATGDINASGVFRKGGTAGVGAGTLFTVCTGSTCTGLNACTLAFSGGIRTGGTCP